MTEKGKRVERSDGEVEGKTKQVGSRLKNRKKDKGEGRRWREGSGGGGGRRIGGATGTREGQRGCACILSPGGHATPARIPIVSLRFLSQLPNALMNWQSSVIHTHLVNLRALAIIRLSLLQ